MKVTREMIGAAHDICLKKGDFVLSAGLLEKIYLAMDTLANRDGYKQDAERYRWLREQNSTLEDRTFYVGIDDRAEPEGIMWVGSDLDSAIDAARGTK